MKFIATELAHVLRITDISIYLSQTCIASSILEKRIEGEYRSKGSGVYAIYMFAGIKRRNCIAYFFSALTVPRPSQTTMSEHAVGSSCSIAG